MASSQTTDAEAPAWGGFAALGTFADFATTTPEAIVEAEAILRDELAAIDRSCSRFRADSEISRAHRAGGYPTIISPLLTKVIQAALEIAEQTGGAVDPTVGTAVIELGYDRDFADVAAGCPPEMIPPKAAPGWRCVELDTDNCILRIPEGVRLDLGSTAKAFAADQAASRIANATGAGTLVNLGGDISLAGRAPAEGWPVGLALASRTSPEDADVVVAVWTGGLASSGTSVRTWKHGDRQVHHIVNPATGMSADTCWRLASVAAPSCVAANAASTAAIVWGDTALWRLSQMGLPCRLVRNDGAVVVLGGWPQDTGISPGFAGKVV